MCQPHALGTEVARGQAVSAIINMRIDIALVSAYCLSGGRAVDHVSISSRLDCHSSLEETCKSLQRATGPLSLIGVSIVEPSRCTKARSLRKIDYYVVHGVLT